MVTNTSLPLAVILLAGGTGERCLANCPKQYATLGAVSVLQHALQAMRGVTGDNVRYIVVSHKDHDTWLNQCITLDGSVEHVYGGNTRQASVYAALQMLQPMPPDYVLIHDAARPFVSQDVVTRLLAELEDSIAVIPAISVSDTVKRVQDKYVKETVSRDLLHAIQTPQAFHYSTLYRAHNDAITQNWRHMTDDAMLCEHAGHVVSVVKGHPQSFKITTANDLEMARMIAQTSYASRTGLGYDVHQLVPHNTDGEQVIRLGGIDIEHTHYLRGHSDADVVLHALTDGLLGAIGQGDIGLHFPPSDMTHQNKDSAIFISHALKLLHEANGYFIHADITIIGERPKITPYREAMTKRIADIMQTDTHRINVKATTTETLGFEGKEEGLAVHAIVTVTLPQTMV